MLPLAIDQVTKPKYTLILDQAMYQPDANLFYEEGDLCDVVPSADAAIMATTTYKSIPNCIVFGKSLPVHEGVKFAEWIVEKANNYEYTIPSDFKFYTRTMNAVAISLLSEYIDDTDYLDEGLCKPVISY